jgi:glycosyltransferase involved in cell wall biosynthesis
VQRHLHRAIDSVLQQDRAVDGLVVSVDHDHNGAAVTRNRALAQVDTEWTAFLDSDDELLHDHVRLLLERAEITGADVVYPHFTVRLADGTDGPDPFADREGQPFSADLLRTRNTIPVTALVRTELIRDVGGFRPKGPPENPCDDWGCWEALLAAGAMFVPLHRRTWLWHWGDNTSGRGDAW